MKVGREMLQVSEKAWLFLQPENSRSWDGGSQRVHAPPEGKMHVLPSCEATPRWQQACESLAMAGG